MRCNTKFYLYFTFTLALLAKRINTEKNKYGAKHLLWSWKCEDDKCVQFKPQQDDEIQSLMTCNMLCAGPQLWPMPSLIEQQSKTVVPVRTDQFHLERVFAPSNNVEKTIRQAFDLMLHDLQSIKRPINNKMVAKNTFRMFFNINVTKDDDPRIRLDTDESYFLSIISRGKNSNRYLEVLISATSFCGARHGLETLSQLVWWDPVAGSLVALDAAQVTDAPRFRYRGLLLDTARNFFPVSALLRTVDAMGAVKLNTFHWHASDSQAFPLRLAGAAGLAERGAYGPGAVYSEADVREVVRRGRLRGVRVLLEVDAPAHVGRAWGDLAHCVEQQPWRPYCGEPPCGQLDPKNRRVYELLEKIYAEIIHLTGTDDLFHLGGSPISERCWEHHLNDSDAMALWIEFTKSALQSLQNVTGILPQLTLLWYSKLSNSIKIDLYDFADSLGFQMQNPNWAYNYESGIRTIVSHENAWDFNSGFGEWYEKSGGVSYNSWQRVYEYRPWVQSGAKWIEGGEATIWSRTLNSGGLHARVWPRAAALAERLWSDLPGGANRLSTLRLDILRTRLINRGIPAAPLWSMWCSQNPQTCG